MSYGVDVVTIFPESFTALTEYGVTSRALRAGVWSFKTWNPRDYSDDPSRRVDDRSYGGGPGMVMMAPPVGRAIEAACAHQQANGVKFPHVIYMSPQGAPLTHSKVVELSQKQGLVILAGRYEGIDERVLERFVTEELSLGDFVVSGGELPAMVLLDAVLRQRPGVVGDPESVVQESFVNGLLDTPHYTRPDVYEGVEVPPVLKNGHHAMIQRWRRKQALGMTWKKRPDMLNNQPLSGDDLMLLNEFQEELRGKP
ncbi:MAG: tRNA (guanosine(37)-N1)-methyltransferase TrmD [Ferrovum sp.]|nr:tRNA (guanosine(37)-N1)-methyltransferase TrmD [Ferrovum sp.]